MYLKNPFLILNFKKLDQLEKNVRSAAAISWALTEDHMGDGETRKGHELDNENKLQQRTLRRDYIPTHLAR